MNSTATQTYEKRYRHSFYRHNHTAFFLSLVTLFLYVGVQLFLAYVIQLVTDVGVNGSLSDMPRLLLLSLSCLAAFAFTNLLTLITRRSFTRRAMTQYRDAVFTDLTGKSIHSFYQENAGSYISVLTNDTQKIQDNYLNSLFRLVEYFALLIGALLVMFLYSVPLTLVVLAGCLLPILASSLVSGKLSVWEKRLSDQNESFVNMVKDLLGGFPVIKSFQAEAEASARFSDQNRRLEQIRFHRLKAEDIMNILCMSCGFIVQIGVFLMGSWLSIKGQITIGVVIAFVQLMNYVIQPISNIPQLLSLRKAAGGLIHKIAENASEHQTAYAGLSLDGMETGISFRNVSFGYQPEKPILQNINLELEAGKSYAVVGASGSGKTTLLNLLLGGMSGYSGHLTIDGAELKDIDRNCLYQLISVIQQNVFLFDSSIRDNITMFKDFPEADIQSAIRRSGLAQLVQEKGIDFLCGENGCNLSGGERQRISIARGLLKYSRLLMMDEATAALDAETANVITNAVLDVTGLTKFVITHKIEESTLRRFDQILVLRDGSITEQGTFDELLSLKGCFYSLYQVSGGLHTPALSS